jgi:hypothetical protein
VHERARREQATARAEQERQLRLARREQAQGAKRHAQARHEEQVRLAQLRRSEQARLQARARAEEQVRREMHASHVEQARRVAGRDAQALRQQRLQREEQLRQVVQERDAAPMFAPPPQPTSPQPRQRARPDLRQDLPARQPDIWQRGFPLVNQGPTS